MIECIQRVITNIVERVGTQDAAKESLGTHWGKVMENWINAAFYYGL